MSCRLNERYLHFNSVSDEPCTVKPCWLLISLAICQSLRSPGSDTLLRVLPFLQTPISCALFLPSFMSLSFCLHPFLLSLGSLLFLPLFSFHYNSLTSFSLFFPLFLTTDFTVHVCSHTCTGMLTDLKRDQINHGFLQTEQFSEKEAGKKNILWTLLLDGEHFVCSFGLKTDVPGVSHKSCTWNKDILIVLIVWHIFKKAIEHAGLSLWWYWLQLSLWNCKSDLHWFSLREWRQDAGLSPQNPEAAPPLLHKELFTCSTHSVTFIEWKLGVFDVNWICQP